MKKIYCIVGEDSGDLHTANLLKSLQELDKRFRFRGVGGKLMQAQGVELVAHVRDINFMGFWEVITHLKTIRNLFRTVKLDILDWKPDVVLLVDYPGFNLRLAKWLHGQGIKVIYYISPQLWAWKKGRIETIRRCVDKMFVILPFEQEFYRQEGITVSFPGHPLLDAIHDLRFEPFGFQASKPLIALLPGSRKQEIKTMLPVMLQLCSRFPDYQFVVAGAPSQTADFYRQFIADAPVELVMNETYRLLSQSQAALVTSGTATLETALFKVPQVVCYKGKWLSYQIGKRLVQVKYISLVNLILDRPLVTELIQQDFTAEKLEAELQLLLSAKRRKALSEGYAELHHKLGESGASMRTAKEIWALFAG